MNSTHKSNTTIVSFNCKSIKRSVQCIRDLCLSADIVVLQETWLLPHDLDFIHSIDSEFACAAVSSVDVSAGVLRGRPYGGLAVMWRKARFSDVTVIDCSTDRVMAIRVNLNLRSFLVFNVYMPIDELDNLPDFTNCLARISAITEESDVSAIYVLGDFNAHPTASFGKELKIYCDEQQWIWADVAKLGLSSDTFTFISEAHGSHRWLDHCITTQAAMDTVLTIDVLYEVTWSDHFPLRVICNLNEVAEGLVVDDVHASKTGIRWGIRDSVQIDNYFNYCTNNLVNINDSFICKECESYLSCDRLNEHNIFIDKLYNQIIKVMQVGAKNTLCYKKLDMYKKQVTGWNFHVQESHKIYRLNFVTWITVGKPSTGTIYEDMVNARRIFKNKLRWCQRNEQTIKLDMLAMYRKEGNFPKFWKEIKKFNYKQSLPLKVNGLHEHAQIANMFATKFKVDPQTIKIQQTADYSRPSEPHNEHVVQFTPDQVLEIVKKMKRGKSPGHDELSIEHVIYGGHQLHTKLCKLFNLCVRYSYLPRNLMKTHVVPIAKNKTGDVSSANNYRPISLGTIPGKILEGLLQPILLKNIVIDD